jgi:non-heme chloroperoxidase
MHPCAAREEDEMAMPDELKALAKERRGIVTNDGARLSVIEVGQGRPLVILPAWTNAAIEYWRQIVDFARDHRVIALDMRGHGESDKTEHGYRVARLAADLEGLLAALEVRDAGLMGHSMGCSVIWAYLDLYGPDRATKLVLVDQAATQVIQPWWSEEERLDFGCNQTPEELFELCASLAGPDGERVTRDLFLGLFTPSFPATDAEAIVAEVLKMPRRHAASLMLDHASRDWRDVIGQIRLPALVDGDGRAYSESAGLVMLLCDRHPEAGLAPPPSDPVRGRYYQWLLYMADTIYPAYGRWFHGERFSTEPADALRVREKARIDLFGKWRIIDDALADSPYLLGERLSACDLYLLMLATFFEPMGELLQACPQVARCARAVAARPAVVRALDTHEQAGALAQA